MRPLWLLSASRIGELVAIIAALAACRASNAASKEASRAAPSESSPAKPSPETDSSSGLPPLQASWLESLPLDGAGLAYVTPPVGARESRPLMVAVHGAGDRPEWACGGWRLAASEYAFVVCPRGLPMGSDRFAWDQPKTIQKAVERSVAAARVRFGRYIASGPTIYVGFSQGATLAERALLDDDAAYARVALAEGGYALLRDAAFLRRLKAHGTERALLVCGSAACFTTARGAEAALRRAGLDPQIAGDPAAGHNLNERMQVALRAAWPAFVQGLPNWSSFPGYFAARAR